MRLGGVRVAAAAQQAHRQDQGQEQEQGSFFHGHSLQGRSGTIIQWPNWDGNHSSGRKCYFFVYSSRRELRTHRIDTPVSANTAAHKDAWPVSPKIITSAFTPRAKTTF